MFSRQCWRCSVQFTRCYATNAPTAPPMLLKIRKDMKSAMINKDTNRLNVLRSLMAQTLNASKTNSPIQTDLQMLALLKKTASQSRAASEEFKAAGRQDLADKEIHQVQVLEEYADGVETMGEDEILSTVKEVVSRLRTDANGAKLQMGEVLKTVFGSAGFDGKPVEKAEVAKVVKRVMAES